MRVNASSEQSCRALEERGWGRARLDEAGRDRHRLYRHGRDRPGSAPDAVNVERGPVPWRLGGRALASGSGSGCG